MRKTIWSWSRINSKRSETSFIRRRNYERTQAVIWRARKDKSLSPIFVGVLWTQYDMLESSHTRLISKHNLGLEVLRHYSEDFKHANCVPLVDTPRIMRYCQTLTCNGEKVFHARIGAYIQTCTHHALVSKFLWSIRALMYMYMYM